MEKDLEKGMIAYGKGDYTEALRVFKSSDSQTARAMLGQMYWRGKGVRVNTLTALDLVCQAARENEVAAVLVLAEMFASADAERCLGEDDMFDFAASAHACYDHLIVTLPLRSEGRQVASVMQAVFFADTVAERGDPIKGAAVVRLRQLAADRDVAAFPPCRTRALFAANQIEKTAGETSPLSTMWCHIVERTVRESSVQAIDELRTICIEDNLTPFPCARLARTSAEYSAALSGARCFCFRRAPTIPSIQPIFAQLPERCITLPAFYNLVKIQGKQAIPFLVCK